MKNKNIPYTSSEIACFYQANRKQWKEFYPSEQWVFERIAKGRESLGDVLDVGCACGGLGAALHERFRIASYTGIDINHDAIGLALLQPKLTVPAKYIAGDILEARIAGKFDLVVSLSCADWNIETHQIINKCWERVKDGGFFILSLRVTNQKGINDMSSSYQHINFSGEEKEPEIANYVVFNFRDALSMIRGLRPVPQLIGAYGYWGSPSPTAVTPYERLMFTVFYLQKGRTDTYCDIKTEFFLPLEIYL